MASHLSYSANNRTKDAIFYIHPLILRYVLYFSSILFCQSSIISSFLSFLQLCTDIWSVIIDQTLALYCPNTGIVQLFYLLLLSKHVHCTIFYFVMEQTRVWWVRRWRRCLRCCRPCGWGPRVAPYMSTLPSATGNAVYTPSSSRTLSYPLCKSTLFYCLIYGKWCKLMFLLTSGSQLFHVWFVWLNSYFVK